jgi:hypothetical protein
MKHAMIGPNTKLAAMTIGGKIFACSLSVGTESTATAPTPNSTSQVISNSRIVM